MVMSEEMKQRQIKFSADEIDNLKDILYCSDHYYISRDKYCSCYIRNEFSLIDKVLIFLEQFKETGDE